MSMVYRATMVAAAHRGVDKATASARDRTRQTVRSVGLGRLAGAVGAQSSLRRRRLGFGTPTGVIYARGKTESRANQALLAYSQGATIYPTGGRRWLAFPTNATPKRIGRGVKITPKIYSSSGLVQSIGKLVFVPTKDSKVALLVARKVNVSRRTGRAKAYAGRVPRGSDRKDAVMFVLIRYTTRARRFDQSAIMRRELQRLPDLIAGEVALLAANR